jgi:SPP1 family predicted phage head-tail adaptor
MDKRVEVQSKTRTRSASGEVAETWTTGQTVWAGIFGASGNEQLVGDKVMATHTHEIKMRYSGVTTKDRIKWGTRYFFPVSILNVEEAGVLYILRCVEDVS